MPYRVRPLRCSIISPGWQSNTSQIASSVEKRIARDLPVLSFERLTTDTPTLSASSESVILRRASIISRFEIMAILLYSYKVNAVTNRQNNILHARVGSHSTVKVDNALRLLVTLCNRLDNLAVPEDIVSHNPTATAY